MLALSADVFPKNAVGSVYGMASVGSGVRGMVLSVATGWVVTTIRSCPRFIGFGVIPLISASIVLSMPDPFRLPRTETAAYKGCQ
jgi:ACS family hexuronate transporter-like MFS transporter